MNNQTITNKQATTIMHTTSPRIVRKALKTIEAKGNPKASEILNTFQHPILDDLQQAVTLRILESQASLVWDISENSTDIQARDISFMGFTFSDYYDDNGKAKSPAKSYIFQAVQNELYKLQQREYKREFIPIYTENENGEQVESSAMVTAALQAHLNSVNNQHIRELIEDLRGLLTEKQDKVLSLLLDGYKQKEIATIMGVIPAMITQHIDAIKRKLHHLNIEE